jgi:ATP-dependent exoDNAse (exonuclease V) alpha subunit
MGPGDLLIVDEAGYMDSEQGHEVLRWARERGCRVLLAGDPGQNPSVGAGDFFRINLERSGIHTAKLEEILRQKAEALDGHYLQAAKHFAAHEATKGFHELHQAGVVRELQGQARVEAFADALMRAKDQGMTAVACSPSHRECDQINEAVRRRMLDRGQLRDERELTAVRRSAGRRPANGRLRHCSRE